MTWLPLSREGKFHRMRDGMIYYDPTEYYTEPMFITAGKQIALCSEVRVSKVPSRVPTEFPAAFLADL